MSEEIKNNPKTPTVVVDKAIAVFKGTKGDDLVHSTVVIDSITGQIQNVGAPVDANDATTKAYVNAQDSALDVSLRAYIDSLPSGGADLEAVATNILPSTDAAHTIGANGGNRFSEAYLSSYLSVGLDDGSSNVAYLTAIGGDPRLILKSVSGSQVELQGQDSKLVISGDLEVTGSITGTISGDGNTVLANQYVGVGAEDGVGNYIYVTAINSNPTIIFKQDADQIELTSSGASHLAVNASLRIGGSLGIANSVAATTPGSVTKKMEIFDNSGASLGFIAIYDSIS